MPRLVLSCARTRGLLLLFSFLSFGVPSIASASEGDALPPPDATPLGTDLSVRHLDGRIWIHTSTKELDGKPLSANGLLVEIGDGFLLVDTPYDDDQTRRLLAWARDIAHRPVRRAIVTHAHEDRMGGIGVLHAADISVRALDLTVKLAEQHHWTLPDVVLPRPQLPVRDTAGFEVFFPGSAHSPDNIVLWFPGEKLLFGGCMVKSGDAVDLGNIVDADLKHWPHAVRTLVMRYPLAKTIVPGHGAPGGRELLSHTLSLLGEGK
jgi:metallo-beta-lactamase class B